MDYLTRHTILKYGRSVLCSEEFRSTFSQVHHYSTTVGDHLLGVAAEAVKQCRARGLTDDDTLKTVVLAALCHDIGIMGRRKKYRNDAECLIRHPLDSVRAYIRITGEADERVIDSIKCHMFPLKPAAPKYKAGWILTAADKICSVNEKLGKSPVTEEDRKELLISK